MAIFFLPSNGMIPLTPISDQHRISARNINTTLYTYYIKQKGDENKEKY